MKRFTLAASVTLAVFVPTAAAAKQVAPQHARKYAQLYRNVTHKLGPRAPGRNIVRWGVAPGQGATDAQVLASISVLERMLAPLSAVSPFAGTQANPPVSQVGGPGVSAAQTASTVPTVSSAPTASASSTASAAPTGSSLPACTWQPESGGNPSAVNPTSGAGGYYQIMPSTWAAYGGSGSPQSASMSEQTAIAQKIYQSQGSGAWSNC